MTESDARAVLLLQACERAALLGTADADWAGREARRQLGADAAADVWLGRRAQLALDRLAERQPALRRPLAAAQAGGGGWPAVAVLALAVGFGLLGDGLGGSPRINLLAPPLLLLLAWNLAVYGLLLARALRPRRAAAPTAAGAAWTLVRGWVRLRAAVGGRLHGSRAVPAPARGALAAFAADWLALARPLLAWRAAALQHGGAALLALGTLLALYARGLVFDYQAGWDSTFLDAHQVRALLGVLLGPAALLAGLPLPDAPALAGLRLAAGGGEGAAPWIHRWALTLVLLVVVPRALLAAQAAWRARRLAVQLPLPDDPALQRLLQAGRAATGAPPRSAVVLPYSYRLDPARAAALPAALAGLLGMGGHYALQPGLAQGAEDQVEAWLAPALQALAPAGTARTGADPVLVLLFALTATPERETHGALVRAVRDALRARPAPPQLQVVVDTSGFRQRAWGPDGAERIRQRRSAWQQLLHEQQVVPAFVDLASPDGGSPQR